MTSRTADKQKYRPCVGVVLFNAKGQVWVGHRAGESGPYVWQFPQGGIDKGESAQFSALRELYEETGISVAHLKYLGKTKGWLYYDFPSDHKNRRLKLWRGQRQRWMAYRFTGKNIDINLNVHSPAEFSKFKWVDLADTPNIIVPFKRKIYEHLAITFAPFAGRAK